MRSPWLSGQYIFSSENPENSKKRFVIFQETHSNHTIYTTYSFLIHTIYIVYAQCILCIYTQYTLQMPCTSHHIRCYYAANQSQIRYEVPQNCEMLYSYECEPPHSIAYNRSIPPYTPHIPPIPHCIRHISAAYSYVIPVYTLHKHLIISALYLLNTHCIPIIYRTIPYHIQYI